VAADTLRRTAIPARYVLGVFMGPTVGPGSHRAPTRT
jgi:transglutaminase-like putative cysteine protease